MESSIKDYDLRDAFSTERRILSFCGFYPLRKKTRIYPLYVFSSFFHLSFCCGQLASMIAESYINRGDLSKLTDTLFFCITQVTFLCKLYRFCRNKKNILDMEEQLKNPVFYGFSSDQFTLIKNKIKSGVFMGLVYRIMTVICLVFFAIFPFLDEARGSLPLKGYLPYNTTKYYFETTAFQLTSLCITANTNIAIDVLTWISINECCAQFAILKDNLRTMHYSNGQEVGTAELAFQKKRFKGFILHHNAILRLVATVESTFSNGIFLQFFASVIIICVTCFQLVFVVPLLSIPFNSLLSYLLCMLIQVSMYCWCGHDLMLTSDGISEQFYMSNWYESDVSLRKTMVIFLERTKRPVMLTAGKLIPLSLATLITILRSAYSYFTVLRQMYQD